MGKKLFHKYLFYKKYLNLIYGTIDKTPLISKLVNNFFTLNEVLSALNNYYLRDYYWFKNSNLSIEEVKDNLPKNAFSPYQSVFKAWLKAFAHKRSKGISGEKTPIHVLYMKEIQEIFKNAMFIHIVRDPYSTIASLKKMPWASNDVKDNAKLWIKCTNVDTTRIKNYYRINFEDLISEPRKVMAGICGFLEIDLQDRMFGQAGKNIEESGEYWKKYASDKISSEKITSNEQELSELEVKKIKELLERHNIENG